jgi:hypothetical protein
LPHLNCYPSAAGLEGGPSDGEATEHGNTQGVETGNWAALPGGGQVGAPPNSRSPFGFPTLANRAKSIVFSRGGASDGRREKRSLTGIFYNSYAQLGRVRLTNRAKADRELESPPLQQRVSANRRSVFADTPSKLRCRRQNRRSRTSRIRVFESGAILRQPEGCRTLVHRGTGQNAIGFVERCLFSAQDRCSV